MEEPLFSFILLAPKEKNHLLSATLDTLKTQTTHDFEIILLGGNSKTIKLYPELQIRAVESLNENLAVQMNQGLSLARGKYIQFLESGDRYLSQHGLAYLTQLIQESQNPQFVYSGFLHRGPLEPPKAMNFPLNSDRLQKGTLFRTSWFLKKSLKDLGGFDLRYTHRPLFDLLCRLFLRQEKLHAIYSRRVFIDSPTHSLFTADLISFTHETCLILKRHFGLWPALRWIFIQDHIQLLKWVLVLLKQAFWKKV